MIGVVFLLRDVTKLQELNRLKSEFVMTASHELRTPLTSIIMSVELLEEQLSQKIDPSQKQLLSAAREELKRLQALVNDLLDLSRIESGQIGLALEAVSVNIMIEKAISVMKAQADEKQISIETAIPKDAPPVTADINKIVWVVTNLLANAIRFSNNGGSIRIRAEKIGKQMHVSVADNGPGIPPEYQARIFDKFVQVQGIQETKGTGLGLAICKEIVKAHRGIIWVDSLPAKVAPSRSRCPWDNNNHWSYRIMNEKAVLIVDDEKNIRLTLSKALEPLAAEIETAGDGREALEKLKQKPYNLMLLDLKMPGIDGMEVLRRTHAIYPQMRVIIITAYGTIASAVEAMKLGAVDFIQKPFSPVEIRNLVSQVFGRETLDSQDAGDYRSLIEVAKRYIGLRDFSKALEHVRKAIAIDASQAEAFNLQGVLLEIKGDKDEAIKSYRTAVSMDPSNMAAKENLERSTGAMPGEGVSLDESKRPDNKW